jgi:hypothetical protein
MSELAGLYSAADVHLLTSLGEGFGLPTLQAASAGVVPIVAANSASTELIGRHGFAVRCDGWTTDEFGLVRGFIDRRQAALVLQALHDDPRLLGARSLAARRYALDFTWDGVAARWDSLLTGHQSDPGGDRSSDDAERSDASRPSSTGLRPTGHDPSTLPIPRLGMPVRLELQREPALVGTRPSVVVEASCASGLRPLERVFPGASVVEIGGTISEASGACLALIERATLVVDPHGRLPGLDRVCALRGVNFLGTSPLWPSVAGKSVLLQARLLLTDHPLAEERASVAGQRARDPAPTQVARSDPQAQGCSQVSGG